MALPLGRLRARREGGAGGHNGLKSIIQSLATQAFPRMRVGVGRGDGQRDLADHVLGRFGADERDTVSAAVLRAADATEMFLSDGIERVMNAFNAAEQQDGPRNELRRSPCHRQMAMADRSRTLDAKSEIDGIHKEQYEQRTYELIYVLKPDASESEVADLHKQVAEIVERMGGTIDKTENGMPWGRRKLAYEIGHHKEGFYVLEVITG